jgi:hypothetical protein
VPKVKWGVTGSEVDEVEPGEEFEQYDGPVPPRAIYRVTVKRIEYVKFSTNSKGIKLLLIIDETRKEKKVYNGCPLWENIVDVPASAFKIRQFLDAIGATGADWDNTVIDKENMVTKIGRIAVDGLTLRVSTKTGTNQDGDKRAEVARFLSKASASAESDSDDGDDGDEGEAPF